MCQLTELNQLNSYIFTNGILLKQKMCSEIQEQQIRNQMFVSNHLSLSGSGDSMIVIQIRM